MKSKWKFDKKISVVEKLRLDSELSDISDTQLRILINRGLDSKEKIFSFLYDGLNKLHNTKLMKDAEKAVDLIIRHKEQGNTAVIHSDYDSDGGHGGAVGVLGFKKVGFENVHVYANNRFTQGYGLLPSSVDEIIELYPDVKLIVTVDNGIVAYEGVEYARSKGIDVIITDHHEPDESGKSPNANAIVNPHQKDCNYPYKYLCGTGVIFKLILLLCYKCGVNPNDAYELLDLVAMATVGDVVPITGENRILVREGLKRIKKGDRYVFRVFQEITNTQEINSHYTLGFVYVPMINAVGRLEGTVDDVFKMYLSDDEDEIKKIAKKLHDLNQKRKDETTHQYEIAEKLIFDKYGTIEHNKLPKAIVLWHDEFTPGIVGLVAGRLKEKFNRPVVVLSHSKKGELKGSARSINGYHIKNAFFRIKKTIIQFGGHEKAGGLGVLLDDIETFEKALVKDASERLTDEDLIKVSNIDDVLYPDKLSINIVDEIKELEPYGEGFSSPTLAISTELNDNPYFMGKDSAHVKFDTPLTKVKVIIWGKGMEISKILKKRQGINKLPISIKALGYPSINIFRNEISLQFIVDGDNYKLYY